MHQACTTTSPTLVSLLLDAGAADLNFKNRLAETPLALAILSSKNKLEISRILIRAGASLDCVSGGLSAEQYLDYRENIRYNVNRGAFGILKDNSIDISWASTRNDSIFSWSFPFQNRPGKPASVNYNFSEFWDVKEAVHAGPVLIRNGKINVSSEQEVFFNTPVDGVQPRSAIGYKKNGDAIMMVVDGRQVDSRGVYLKELAM